MLKYLVFHFSTIQSAIYYQSVMSFFFGQGYSPSDPWLELSCVGQTLNFFSFTFIFWLQLFLRQIYGGWMESCGYQSLKKSEKKSLTFLCVQWVEMVYVDQQCFLRDFVNFLFCDKRALFLNGILLLKKLLSLTLSLHSCHVTLTSVSFFTIKIKFFHLLLSSEL